MRNRSSGGAFLVPLILVGGSLAGLWFFWDQISHFLPIQIPKLLGVSIVAAVETLVATLLSFRAGAGWITVVFWIVLEAALGVLGDQLLGSTWLGRLVLPGVILVVSGIAIFSRSNISAGVQTGVEKGLKKAISETTGAAANTTATLRAMATGPNGEKLDLAMLANQGFARQLQEMFEVSRDAEAQGAKRRQHLLDAVETGAMDPEIAGRLLAREFGMEDEEGSESEQEPEHGKPAPSQRRTRAAQQRGRPVDRYENGWSSSGRGG